MSTQATIPITQETIWSRIIDADQGDLTREAADYFLKLDFRPSDHERIAELSEKANGGTLTSLERAELEEYIRVGDLIALIQSKARRSLKQHGQVA